MTAVSGGQQVKEEKGPSHADDKLFNATPTPGKLTRPASGRERVRLAAPLSCQKLTKRAHRRPVLQNTLSLPN